MFTGDDYRFFKSGTVPKQWVIVLTPIHVCYLPPSLPCSLYCKSPLPSPPPPPPPPPPPLTINIFLLQDTQGKVLAHQKIQRHVKSINTVCVQGWNQTFDIDKTTLWGGGGGGLWNLETLKYFFSIFHEIFLQKSNLVSWTYFVFKQILPLAKFNPCFWATLLSV